MDTNDRFRKLVRFTFGHTYFQKRKGGFKITVDCKFTADHVLSSLREGAADYQLEIVSVTGNDHWFVVKFNDAGASNEAV